MAAASPSAASPPSTRHEENTMSRRTTAATFAAIAIVTIALAAYVALGSVLPNDPEGSAMRDNLTVLAAVLATVFSILLASFSERS